MTNLDLLCITLGIMISFGLLAVAFGYYLMSKEREWLEKRR